MERLFRKLAKKFDPEGRVQILRSTNDPELGRYLEFVNALAATDMDENGFISIKVHDETALPKGLWLEEFAHALQFLNKGNIPLSCDDQERNSRELEVAVCLQRRAGRQKLPLEDIEYLEKAIKEIGEAMLSPQPVFTDYHTGDQL